MILTILKWKVGSWKLEAGDWEMGVGKSKTLYESEYPVGLKKICITFLEETNLKIIWKFLYKLVDNQSLLIEEIYQILFV